MCSIEGPPLKKRRPQLMHVTESLPIYLDYNATTPVCQASWSAIESCRTHWGNPSSTHPYGLDANFVVQEARAQCAGALGVAQADHFLFTSGGTEANNLAIIGGAIAARRASAASATVRDVVVATNFEHPAVDEVLTAMETEFRDVWIAKRVSVDPASGLLTAAALEEFLRTGLGLDPHRVALVTIMHANNELGTVSPIRELAGVAKRVCGDGVLFHTDAAQSIGKVPVNLADLGVDYLSVCSHKFYGPKGVGGLCVRPGAPMPARVTYGAKHEYGIRPGTENIILYRGMAAALLLAVREQPVRAVHMQACRETLLQTLEMELAKSRKGLRLWINGSLEHTLPNTLNISIGHQGSRTYISAQRLMEEVGHLVCVSAGSACHSTVKPGEELVVSSSLRAVGVDKDRAVGTLRLSCGAPSTLDEMRRAGRIIARKAAQQVTD